MQGGGGDGDDEGLDHEMLEASLSTSEDDDNLHLQRRHGVIAGVVLVLLRTLGAIINCIADCDETYN